MYDDVLLPVATGGLAETPIVERVLEFAAQPDAARHLLGAVTENVVRTAPVPVLTVPL
ncbi:hypothetical protein [Halolamina sp.]|uniref:hypothetical protein n=1 Tax=Halolamina sp. TaxID=1940283 RepID=UPI0035694007